MAIAPELRAQILRLYQGEHWRVGTLAKQLQPHRDTVLRVLTQNGITHTQPSIRPSGVDPYLPFMRETLTKRPHPYRNPSSRHGARAWFYRWRRLLSPHRGTPPSAPAR